MTATEEQIRDLLQRLTAAERDGDAPSAWSRRHCPYPVRLVPPPLPIPSPPGPAATPIPDIS